jgi:hypothetical protein
MTSQQYVKRISLATLIATNHVPNSPARKRARYVVPSPSTYSGTALATRSFHSHPGSSIPIVRHSEDSLKAENLGRTQREGAGQSRCTPFDAQRYV